ncbi:prenyltransferase [Lactobacillus sp. DCY120]|uniref:Prenyltransferase n=1 Tax=Bombilactobacillus apium TaxID=2675299 RepID=A0A850R2C6_9LACO|nr:prenyltransferase [Bombilactobacillus apium]NVY96171.1 prenyltransferase [Bombilactobacillus apium]
MNWKVFYQMSGLSTPPLDLAWLILAASFSYYYWGRFNWLAPTIALVIVFMFHLIINIQNDLYDFEHASTKTAYKEKTNNIGLYKLDLQVVKKWLAWLAILPIALGLLLAYFTGWPTLVIGSLAAIFGLGYSAGPRPWNSTPLCEFCVAFPIAYMIPLTYVYLGNLGHLTLDWTLVGRMFLVALLPLVMIYIMQLANNICDLQEDVPNGRYTLVYFLTAARAIKLFYLLYWLSAGGLILVVCWGLAPWLTLLTLPLYLIFNRPLQILRHNQHKKEIYNQVIVKHCSQITMTYIALYLVGTIFHLIF